MLDFMRQRARSLWIKALFLVIALVFGFFGIGSFGDDSQVQIVVTVDDEPITLQEFQRAYRNVESNYREIYKERFTPELAQQMNLRQQTLDQLVDARLLAKEARRIGFSASDEGAQEIAPSPPSQLRRFSPDRYVGCWVFADDSSGVRRAATRPARYRAIPKIHGRVNPRYGL